jgi:hypothetical protein
MAGITLAQLAKLETNPLRKTVIMNLLRKAKIMEVLPFTNVNALQSVAVRWRTLPSVDFRKINEGYTSNETGDTEQVWESVYGFGGDITYDRVLDKIAGSMITDPKRLQMDMKLAAMAFKFNDYFINGDHATEPDGFEGLKKRVAGMPTRQTVGFAASNAAALDPTASAAAAGVHRLPGEDAHLYQWRPGRWVLSATKASCGVWARCALHPGERRQLAVDHAGLFWADHPYPVGCAADRRWSEG